MDKYHSLPLKMTILYMLRCHQFLQEVINLSLITRLNVDYILCTRSCLFCTECGHCSASLHCLFRHGKQRVVILADSMAPKATGGIKHHLITVVYRIYQVM